MFACVKSAGLMGIEAFEISVEVDIQQSQLPKWFTVGLPESAVKEGKDRVVAAIKNSSYDFIYRRVTINLAPADLKKDGSAFDLPIAIGLMLASETLICDDVNDTLMLGELSLMGDVRAVKGVLPIAIMAKERGFKKLFVPKENAAEAAIVKELAVYGFTHLREVVEFMKANLELQPHEMLPFETDHDETHFNPTDFSDIHGQYQAKRAMEVAASGGHNILLSGSPGAGKSMIASRIPTILPPLTFEESLETSKIYSVIGLLRDKHRLLTIRPFRDPHHSISNAGLIGGGSHPKPGEVSLAHNGVLFLDELPEFQKHVLELLRQPLETHQVTISRATTSLTYPARFMLVASCNPCPCGYQGHPKVACSCSPLQIQHYKGKLSGPLLDRIDIQIDVPPVPYDEFRNRKSKGETSAEVRARVTSVRELQRQRFSEDRIYLNSQMTPRLIEKHCLLDDNSEKILKASVDKFHLSARAMSRILKVSRTIADMHQSDMIKMDHILEAVQYRGIDWSSRGFGG